jgi:TIR domain/Effector-associated domain 7
VNATAQIFLSYAREDRHKVESLYQQLSDAGFRPWMDTKDILAGEKWQRSIQHALQQSQFFLACLSLTSVTKRSYLRREFREALEKRQEMLDSDIYLIPVRLEECEIPEELREHQGVDLFKEDGWTRLVEALQVGMERRGEGIPQTPLPHERPTPPPGPAPAGAPTEVSHPGPVRGTQPGSSSPRQDPTQVPPADTTAHASALRRMLVERFDLEELRTLCSDLSIDYDALRGEGKEARARELIAYLQRRRQLDRLTSYIRQHRPDIQFG